MTTPVLRRVGVVAAATTLSIAGLSLATASAYAAPAAPSSHVTSGTAGTSGDATSPQPISRADSNAGGANGQCTGGPYCSTRDGSPSGNGNGGGKATGKPCAGCVGKADNKNPKGQMPGGSDRNAGYECDRNHGIGRGNPAHTGCTTTTPVAVPPVTTGGGCPQGQSMVDGVCATDEQGCPAGAEMVDGACVLGEGDSRNPGDTEGTPVLTPGTSGGSADVPATVLGESFSRVPGGAAVAGSATSLPFTGAPTGELLLLAAVTLAAGGALTTAGRRRSQG